MADNDSLAKKFARVLANPESSNTELEEARTVLEMLSNRGSIYAREVLAQFPVVRSQTEHAVLGASPELVAVLADIDALSEANRLENKSLAPTRAARRAELEAAITHNNVPAECQPAYRRTLEIYQQGNYSFAEETTVFEGLLSDIAERWKHVPKRV